MCDSGEGEGGMFGMGFKILEMLPVPLVRYYYGLLSPIGVL